MTNQKEKEQEPVNTEATDEFGIQGVYKKSILMHYPNVGKDKIILEFYDSTKSKGMERLILEVHYGRGQEYCKFLTGKYPDQVI